MALLNANEEPANATAKRFDHVPKIQGIKDSQKTQWSSFRGAALVFSASQSQGWVRRWVVTWFGAGNIWLVGEGPDMQNSKDGHLEAEKERRDADLEVRVGQNLVGLYNAQRGCAHGDGSGLPERQENDQFDSQDLQEGSMLGQGFLHLYVELNQTEHGNSHGQRLDNEDL